MSKSISVFGLGYVGTVTAACLAHKGSSVVGVDLSPAKVEALQSGRSPVVEPRVSKLVAECTKACRLHATSDPASAVLKTDISFLCVGTPSLRNGKLDLGHIEPVCRQIGRPQLMHIHEGGAEDIDVNGRKSAAWDQPWLTKCLHWKRAAKGR